MDDDDDPKQLEARLVAWLHDEVSPDGELRIHGLRRTSAGYSRQNWVFDAEWETAGKPVHAELIARRDPPGSVLATDRETEYRLLRALERASVPTPRARWLDADGRRLGRPTLVMDREAGECDWFVLNGARPLQARRALAEELLDALVAIARVDWRALGIGEFLDDPGPDASQRALDFWEHQIRDAQLEPLPELEIALSWLRAHAPTSRETVLVHADFKPGNTLLRGDRLGVILDWELAHLGDPVEDVAWVTQPLRAREHQIPGVWERAQILERFHAATGIDVSDEELRWWHTFALFRTVSTMIRGTAAYVDGRYDRAFHFPGRLFTMMFDLIGV
jgi:aminoglycoside phosphotransferase (APT) family kinase protein